MKRYACARCKKPNTVRHEYELCNACTKTITALWKNRIKEKYSACSETASISMYDRQNGWIEMGMGCRQRADIRPS